jgi:hypothetical protein
LQSSQLVAEGKILEDHVVVATAGHGDRTQEQQCPFKHVLILSGVAAESNTGRATTTFWRTTATGGLAGCSTSIAGGVINPLGRALGQYGAPRLRPYSPYPFV